MVQEAISLATAAVPQNYNLAISAIAITIMAGGIALGVGIALQNRRLKNFGVEELAQSVLNAALLGSIAALLALLGTVGTEFVPQGEYAACMQNQGATGAAAFAICINWAIADGLYKAGATSLQSAQIIGYVAKMIVSVPGLSNQPFYSSEFSAQLLSSMTGILYAFAAIANLHAGFFEFAYGIALSVALPAGFFLRSFHITRALGGALIGFSVAILTVYALCFVAIGGKLALLEQSIGEAGGQAAQFNSDFGSVLEAAPTDTGFFATVQQLMAQGQLTARTGQLLAAFSQLLSQLALYIIVLPLAGLALSLAFGLAISRTLGGQIITQTYEYV
ncbi:hypothetical protein FJZ26_00220 [Candidatus Parvarchaeota archaeon]|nr:hypothetical protein [Candidatus Parvarchaeota archaeon]